MVCAAPHHLLNRCFSTCSRSHPSFFTVRSSSSLQDIQQSSPEFKEQGGPGSLLFASAPFPLIKAAKRVVLVRHGQSTWNEEGRIQGSSNFSVLTKKGEVQAETSSQMLVDDAFDVCFSRFVLSFYFLIIFFCSLSASSNWTCLLFLSLFLSFGFEFHSVLLFRTRKN